MRQVNSAVLFLTYRRIDTAIKVFQAIREARPSRLYFASNAPDPKKPDDPNLVAQVRHLRTRVDWPCELQTLFRTEHRNVKDSITEALDWFFSHEEEGIILEDDCLPHPDFFRYCDVLLDRYRYVDTVAGIGGVVLEQANSINENSYHFTKYLHIWGWATWRRTWKAYDPMMSFWPEFRKGPSWPKIFNLSRERRYWERQFEATYEGKIKTWDYQLLAGLWSRGQLAIAPSRNLVSNLGFGHQATFTSDPLNPYAERPTYPVFPMTHPPKIEANKAAEISDFEVGFGGAKLKLRARLMRKLSRSWFLRILRVSPPPTSTRL